MKKIPLTQGKFAIVDDEDYDYLMQWKWYADKGVSTFYAKRNIRNEDGKRAGVKMHRVILGVTSQKTLVDHINHDGLDCRKSNMRICSSSGNNKNRSIVWGKSKYKGVCWHVNQKKFNAKINVDGRGYHLGCFSSEIEAATAYNEAALQYHGEFACLNEIQDNLSF
jgi:hypothetical protein